MLRLLHLTCKQTTLFSIFCPEKITRTKGPLIKQSLLALQLVLLKHLKLEYKLIRKMNFHLSYLFWLKTTLLEIQSLLNSEKKEKGKNKKKHLQTDTLSREFNFIKPEHFIAYQVGLLFSGNILMIFLSSFGDSVVSLRIAGWEAAI